MLRKHDDGSRRIELVPLIDVIFLLLIFFLVTLNIIPIISRRETLESTYAMEVVTPDQPARIDRFIQLHQFPGDPQVYYFLIDEAFQNVPIPLVLANLNDRPRMQQIFRGRWFTNPKAIPLHRGDRVLIGSTPWAPYEALFELIEACKVSQVGKYDCVMSSFEQLGERFRFVDENRFVEIYEWN